VLFFFPVGYKNNQKERHVLIDVVWPLTGVDTDGNGDGNTAEDSDFPFAVEEDTAEDGGVEGDRGPPVGTAIGSSVALEVARRLEWESVDSTCIQDGGGASLPGDSGDPLPLIRGVVGGFGRIVGGVDLYFLIMPTGACCCPGRPGGGGKKGMNGNPSAAAA